MEITQDIVEESEDERFDEMSDSAPPIDLPPCELSRLEEINEVSRQYASVCRLLYVDLPDFMLKPPMVSFRSLAVVSHHL